MARDKSIRQYPLRLDWHYKVLQSVGGLKTGEVVRILNLRPKYFTERSGEFEITVVRPNGDYVEVILRLPPGVVRSYFEPVDNK